MNYKKEAKEIVQKYSDKFHIIFRDQKEAESLAQIAFMKGYNKGLDFALNKKRLLK